MPSVQVSAVKKTPVARDFPTFVTWDKPYEDSTVLDVKKAIAAKNPKV